MNWLLDTLVWTGALIALVLVARRPVARQFGAKAAYALWALPLLRLFLPPIVLPAWLAPAAAPVAIVATDNAHVPIADAAMFAQSIPAEVPAAIDWALIAIAVWLIGALTYFTLRLAAYARLRSELLANGREVGREGRVRFVETAATASPVAFGVLDKVVALPCGFMAQPDRAARNLALAHELAHHRAHDLAANFAALPLFALHWFNPLSWLGWHALRRDQEAACDARVIEGRDRGDRALYASVIAGAAATPNPTLRAALAAPMACPVLGDKSIIHRLRALTMTNHTNRRRRAGMLLVAGAALALPLTASISYAADQAPLPPEPPMASEPPLAPDWPEVPMPPEAPLPPAAPLAPEAHEQRIIIDENSPDGTRKERRVMVFRSGDNEHLAVAPGGVPAVHHRRIVMRGNDGKAIAPDSPEFEAHMKKFEKEMEQIEARMEKLGPMSDRWVEATVARAEAAGRMGERAAAMAVARAPRVIESCEGEESVSESNTANGRRVTRFCQSRIAGRALMGLKMARGSIARNTEMSAEVRADVLADLDKEIARLEAGKD